MAVSVFNSVSKFFFFYANFVLMEYQLSKSNGGPHNSIHERIYMDRLST